MKIKEPGMKSLVSRRVGFLVGVFAILFSVSAAAEVQLEPTWVKEGVDWSRYSKFLVKPLNVDDVEVLKPPYAQDDPSDWTLDIQDMEGLQAIFTEAMKDALEANDGWPIVSTDGADVLEVEVEILNITPWLKPGGDESLAGYEVKTLGSGEITGRVELRDSTTRELLLLIEGEKAVGEQYTEFTRENNIANLNSMFTDFATRLRNSMDRVHGK
jgi:hypothetical protein